MTRYKFDKHAGLVDDTGKCILQLVPVCCTNSFRVTAGKELANKLNGIEQGKEASKRKPTCGVHTFVSTDICGCK